MNYLHHEICLCICFETDSIQTSVFLEEHRRCLSVRSVTCVAYLSCRQASERMALQKQLQRLMEPNKAEGTPSRSPR